MDKMLPLEVSLYSGAKRKSPLFGSLSKRARPNANLPLLRLIDRCV